MVATINWYSLAGSASGFLVIFLILNSNYSLFSSFKEDDKNFTAILDEMAPRKRVDFLIFDGDSRFAYSPGYLHYGVWYQAEKGGEVFPSFAHEPDAYGVPVRYKHKTWAQASPWNAEEFNWYKHSGAIYDYFLVRSNQARDYLFTPSKDIVLIDKQGKWYLYGRASLKDAVTISATAIPATEISVETPDDKTTQSGLPPTASRESYIRI